MSNNDSPHGFKVYGELLRAGMYAVATNPTIGFYVGDIVSTANTSVACTKGRGEMVQVYGGAVVPATPGATYPLLGAVIGCYDENMFPVLCIKKLTIGDGTLAGYLLVADHPKQLFEAQEDGAVAAIAQTDVGLNFEIASVALSLGNAFTGVSTQEIDSDSHVTTSTSAVRVLDMAHPQEDTIGSAGCRWVCQISPLAHLYGIGTAI